MRGVGDTDGARIALSGGTFLASVVAASAVSGRGRLETIQQRLNDIDAALDLPIRGQRTRHCQRTWRRHRPSQIRSVHHQRQAQLQHLIAQPARLQIYKYKTSVSNSFPTVLQDWYLPGNWRIVLFVTSFKFAFEPLRRKGRKSDRMFNIRTSTK